MSQDAMGTPPGLTLQWSAPAESERIGRIAWSTNGSSIAIVAVDRLVIWDVAARSRRQLLSPGNGIVWDTSWSHDGARLAVGRGNEIVIVNASNGLPAPILKVHSGPVYSVAWSRDGKLCASGSADRSVRIWDTRTWRQLRSFDHGAPVRALAWSPDSKRLGSASEDSSIAICLAGTGAVERLTGHSSGVLSLTWSADGELIASASADKTIRIWDVPKAETLATLEGHTGVVYSVAFSRDGKVLASRSADNTVRLWNSAKWQALASIEQPASEYDRCWPAGPQFDPTGGSFAALGESDRHLSVSALDTSILCRSTAYPRLTYAVANVVLVGDAGVGKSGIAGALGGQSFRQTTPSHARSVTSLDTREALVPGGGRQVREVLLWDFGGHPAYRLLHQFSLDQADVALLVFDGSSPELGGVQTWARILRQPRPAGERASAFPILAVAARVDDGAANFVNTDFDGLASALDLRGTFITSGMNGSGIAGLREAIDRAIDWSTIPQMSPSEFLPAIKEFLADERSRGRSISNVDELYAAFSRTSGTEAPESREAFERDIQLLGATGFIRIPRSGGQILLRPEVLDTYAAAILLIARQAPTGTGSVSEKELLEEEPALAVGDRVSDRQQERLVILAVIAELIAMELAIRDVSGPDALLIFPSEVRREWDELPTEFQSGFVTYHFAGPIEKTYATLAVSLESTQMVQHEEFWYSAVEYTAGEGGTCGLRMRELGGALAELILFSSAPRKIRTDFEQYVRNHLERHAVPGSIQRVVHAGSGEEAPYQVIEKVADSGVSVVDPILKIRSELSKGNPGLVDEQELDRKRSAARARLQTKIQAGDFDVFLSYHVDDRRTVLEIGNHLRQLSILPWIDVEQIRPGENWPNAKAEQYARTKAVAVLIGQKRIGNFNSEELNALLGEATRRRLQIIPVILPSIVGEPSLPSFLADLAYVDFRQSDPNPFEVLIWGITGLQAGIYAGGEGRDDEKLDLDTRLSVAENRGDWDGTLRCLVKIAERARKAGSEEGVVQFAGRALAVADDPLKLDGKGLKEPLEILGSVKPDEIAVWLPHCCHREIALEHLRAIAETGDIQTRVAMTDLLSRAGIQSWRAWFEHPDEAAISGLPVGSSGCPSARVRRLRLKQIKSFAEFTCDLLEEGGSTLPLSVFVGDNSTGKSTLLQSLALGYLGSHLANRIEGISAKDFLRNGAEAGSIELEVELSVDPSATTAEKATLCLGLGLDHTHKDFYPLPADRMSLGGPNQMDAWNLLRGRAGLHWGFCAGYGPSRALRERVTIHTAPAEIDWVASLFQSQATLLEPAVLGGILQADISGLSRNPSAIPLSVRDSILAIFRDLIPGVEVKEQQGKMRFVEVHSGVSLASALSDSCNSMVALLAHLVRHTLEVTGWVRNPCNAEGIVLVDDVDLHLDVLWQRVVLQQLARAFPRLQFMVTTRSPVLLGHIPDRMVSFLGRFEGTTR